MDDRVGVIPARNQCDWLPRVRNRAICRWRVSSSVNDFTGWVTHKQGTVCTCYIGLYTGYGWISCQPKGNTNRRSLFISRRLEISFGLSCYSQWGGQTSPDVFCSIASANGQLWYIELASWNLGQVDGSPSSSHSAYHTAAEHLTKWFTIMRPKRGHRRPIDCRCNLIMWKLVTFGQLKSDCCMRLITNHELYIATDCGVQCIPRNQHSTMASRGVNMYDGALPI